LISPATAQELGVGMGKYAHGGEHGGYYPDVMRLEVGERSVQAPIWIMPGHANHAITVYLGYGREFAGRIGGSAASPVGFNAYRLRRSAAPWFAPGLQLSKTGKTMAMACTQAHHLMENRNLVRSADLKAYAAH